MNNANGPSNLMITEPLQNHFLYWFIHARKDGSFTLTTCKTPLVKKWTHYNHYRSFYLIPGSPTSQAVEGTWICTGSQGQFRGKWVKSDLSFLELSRLKKTLERVHKPTCSLEKNFSLCMLWKAAEHVWKIMVILNEQNLGVHELYIYM